MTVGLWSKTKYDDEETRDMEHSDAHSYIIEEIVCRSVGLI